MYAFLMTLFIILSLFLAIFVLIQQGKGDLGLGSMGGSQMLFGGSGGQDFFEKTTWVMVGLFVFGSLGLSILKSKEVRSSVLEGASLPARAVPAPLKSEQNIPIDVDHSATPPMNQADQSDENAPVQQQAANVPVVPAHEPITSLPAQQQKDRIA